MDSRIFCSWPVSREKLSLSFEEVHVWCFNLSLEPEKVDNFKQILDEEERDRAARFHFDRDRNWYVGRHGCLRVILSRYLNLSPAQIRYVYSQSGKPALDPSIGAPQLGFNLSSSRALALIAIAMERRVGVDIEYVRADSSHTEVAGRYFSPGEQSALAELRGQEKVEAFFNCWTRKEAYIKARGEGLSHPLDGFDVSLVPGEPAELLATHTDPGEAQRWKLQHLAPAQGYVGAVAVEGEGWRLRCWQGSFPDE